MALVKWERLESGVYRWLSGNSKGDFVIWVERGCDTHAGKYPNWYWTVAKLGEKEVLNKLVGNEMSLVDAMAGALAALHSLLEDRLLEVTG